MYERITQDQKNIAKIMKALAHPARIYIIEEISKNKICVCSLAKKLNLSFAGISRHFSILKNVGIVREEKERNNIYYRLVSNYVLLLLKSAKNVDECIASKKI